MVDYDELVDASGGIDEAEVGRAIDELSRRARDDRAVFDAPQTPPASDRAMDYLREGAGQAIGLYVYLRTGGRRYRFAPAEFEQLESAMNTWFSLYTACYGVETDPDVSLRTAAEALINTDNIRDVAQIVTGVPAD